MSGANTTNSALMSKLMDGDISELELHRLLKAMDSSDELRAEWAQWHMERDSYHGVDVELLDLSMADRVSAAIGDEEYAESVAPAANDSWWQSAKQLTVAACAAVFVIALVPMLGEQSSDSSTLPAFQSVDQTVYDLNEQWSLPSVPVQTVAAQSGYAPTTLAQPSLNNESAASLEEQQRVQELMGAYMMLHATKAGINTSSVRSYLQVAPR